MRALALVSAGLFILVVEAAGGAPPVQDRFQIVEPDWLEAHLDDASVRVIDARTNPYPYFTGHVPGAAHLSDALVRGPRGGLPAQFLAPELARPIFTGAGVAPSDIVVVYSDDKDVLGATLVAYALLRIGHADVRILDGGWQSWSESRATSQAYPAAPKDSGGRDAGGAGPDHSLFVTLDEVRSLLKSPEAQFIDARPPNVFRGETNTWLRNGHIPGAINVDWTTLMDASNPHRFRERAEIEALLASRGASRDRDVIVYCGTGREASLLYLYIRHELDWPRVRLYEGSWAEYAAAADLPVETGEAR